MIHCNFKIISRCWYHISNHCWLASENDWLFFCYFNASIRDGHWAVRLISTNRFFQTIRVKV